ncbi:MAG: hypothetical protein M3300_05510 [Actinomycetota bacterium]|nr:hypothetical protein [Actinomycetota bacterium]
MSNAASEARRRYERLAVISQTAGLYQDAAGTCVRLRAVTQVGAGVVCSRERSRTGL